MISNYYVLAALADEWRQVLVGGTITDAYSQSADELSLVIDVDRAPAHPDPQRMAEDSTTTTYTLRMSTAAPLRYLLLSAGSGRARRNTADVLGSIVGETVTHVDTVTGDRILDLSLSGGRKIQFVLFGSGANAFVVGDDGVIVEAFQGGRDPIGKRVPVRAAATIPDLETFVERWKTEASGSLTCGQTLSRIEQLFNRFMADEVVLRAGVATNTKASEVEPEQVRDFHEGIVALRSLFDRSSNGDTDSNNSNGSDTSVGNDGRGGSASRGRTQHAGPAARIYWTGRRPERLVLFDSVQMADYKCEEFDRVTDAVGVFVRRTLSQKALGDEFAPVLKKVTSAKKRAQRRLEELERELAGSPRAEQYERNGHILMAQPPVSQPLSDPFVASNIFDGGEVEISVDKSLSLIENANRYFEKAKSAKLALESARERLASAQADVAQLSQLADALAAIDTLDDWRKYSKANTDELKPYLPSSRGADAEVPFRQFDLGGGYVVWVGKNARQNELLSSKAARKFDLWFHARGVPGSHVVLRLPHKNTEPDGAVVERAASIAAWYSKARGGSMVPVIVAEAKHVRKPRGAAPGSVVVEKERVLLVEPGLPGK